LFPTNDGLHQLANVLRHGVVLSAGQSYDVLEITGVIPMRSPRGNYRSTSLILIPLVWAAWLTVGGAEEAKFNRVVSVGQQSPTWNDLPGIDGKQHSLRDQKAAKFVVVVFVSNNCGMTRACLERVRVLEEQTRPAGVSWIAVNVLRQPGEDLDAMRTYWSKHKLPFAYVRDESQAMGRKFGATHTPQVFVLDGQRRIAYMGAMDDHFDPKQVTEHYLRDALDALLAGREVEITDTLQKGCPIEYATPEKSSKSDAK